MNMRFFSAASIRTKLLLGFLAVSLLVVAVGVVGIVEQQRLAELATITEAENVAQLIEESITPELLPTDDPEYRGIIGDPELLQVYVTNLYFYAERNMEVVDARQIVIADKNPENIGTVHDDDPNDEVGQTLQDFQTRTFIEKNEEHPEGIRMLVLPVDNEEGETQAAIILEYTEMYEEMLGIVRNTSIIILIGGILCVGLALLIGLTAAESIARPLGQLNEAATAIENGSWDYKLNIERRDEIGHVADAFNQMSSAIQVRETELKKAIQEAREANRLKDMFLATMSHELRTPLNSILTFNQLLGMGTFGPVNDEQKEYLEKSLNSGRHLLALINDVLDITKIQSGMMKLFVENDFDVTRETLDIATTTEKFLEGRPVTLITNIDSDLQHLTCDKRRVRQVLLNLVSNAAKFTEHGTITLSAHRKNGSVQFGVVDTGPGIRPEDHEIIFQPFIQTETGIRHGGGTGLGLPITRSLVKAHGGEIRLDSALGTGAAFFVTLPIQTDLALGEQEI